MNANPKGLKHKLSTQGGVRLHQPGAEAPAPSELIVTPLTGKKVKPVRYLIPGRIPSGKLILIAGRGGSGKSTLLRSVAADLSVGRCALGLTYPNPVRAKTLIVAAEDGPEDTILPGLLAEGADLTRIAILEGVRRGSAKSDFTLSPEHVELVREQLKKSPEIKLVTIDPIASFVGRAKIDDHRATELRLVLDPLSELAEASGVTIAMVAHLNKAGGGAGTAAVDRIAGSAAYRDAVRAAYLICEDADDDTRRLLMPVKENLPGFEHTSIPFGLAPLSEPDADAVVKREQFRHLEADDLAAVRAQLRRVRFFTAVSMDADTALKAKKQDGTKVERCKEWLKTFLAKYAFPSNEIMEAAKKASFTFDNVKEAKSQLKSEGALWNHNLGKVRGEWWSGLGEPLNWKLRPEPTPFSPQTPFSPPSPFSPFLGNTSSFQEGERRERRESEECGESPHIEPPDSEGVL
ncbi:AAA family ATPase [Gemmata sp. G18]|uniref:AAA family ATPase n=1 Tax=Gemmata palustris TaxID=2822762 RepID=A0ABS5BXF9_9BACT|nr:AAA family ATPase [Gemmata palustris]MBP3958427.1 AAA family ATPase [Gemmata palustris]